MIHMNLALVTPSSRKTSTQWRHAAMNSRLVPEFELDSGSWFRVTWTGTP